MALTKEDPRHKQQLKCDIISMAKSLFFTRFIIIIN
jgi:hypothetical protein